jgi:hypothetical protein
MGYLGGAFLSREAVSICALKSSTSFSCLISSLMRPVLGEPRAFQSVSSRQRKLYILSSQQCHFLEEASLVTSPVSSHMCPLTNVCARIRQ